MIKEIQIQVLPEIAESKDLLKNIVAEKSNIKEADIKHIEVLKRSVDARQRITKINLRLEVYIKETFVSYSFVSYKIVLAEYYTAIHQNRKPLKKRLKALFIAGERCLTADSAKTKNGWGSLI